MRKRWLVLLPVLLTLSATACIDSGDSQAQVFDPAVAPKDAEDPYAAYLARDRYCAANGETAVGCTPIVAIGESDNDALAEQFYIDREAYCLEVDVPTASEIVQMPDDAPITSDQFGCALHESWWTWDVYIDALTALRSVESLGFTPALFLKLPSMTVTPVASTCGFECLSVLVERKQHGEESYSIDELARVLDATTHNYQTASELKALFQAYDNYRSLGLDETEALKQVTWFDDEIGFGIYRGASRGYYWALVKGTNGQNESLALYAVHLGEVASQGMGYAGIGGDPDQVRWLIEHDYPVHEALYIVHHKEIEADLDNSLLSPADRAAFQALIG